MADIERFQHWLDTVWIPEFRANKDLRHDSIEKFESFAAYVTAEKDREIERLRGTLSDLVEAVDDLISESEGVYGLRLDGTPSLWEELTEVGWLLALEEARAVLEGEKEARATTAMKGE